MTEELLLKVISTTLGVKLIDAEIERCLTSRGINYLRITIGKQSFIVSAEETTND